MDTLWRLAAAAIWLMSCAMVLVKTPGSNRTLYRLQALGEATLIIALAQISHDRVLWISAAAVLVVKIGVVPRLMAPSIPPSSYGARSPLGAASILAAIGALTVGGILIGRLAQPPHPFAVALLTAAWLTALLHSVSRYETWSLGWALLSLDTASSALAVSISGALPTSIDLLITAVTIGLAILLSLFTKRIMQLKNTTDIRALEELVG